MQRLDCLFEVKDFPESDTDVQKSDATDGAPDPTRRDKGLYSLNAGFLRSIQQEIVVAPVAEAPHPVRPPGRDREERADFKAQDDVKNDAELR